MKNLLKIGVATLSLGIVALGVGITSTTIYGAPEEIKLNIDKDKIENGYKVIKAKYTNDDYKKLDMYYSDGFFAKEANVYNPHMATLAVELTQASTTYKENDNYEQGAKNIKDALKNIGFKYVEESESYKKKPEADSIACCFGTKEIEQKGDMKYKYVIDITVRSASYEAEWASNVKLGKTGEAQGFMEAAEQIMNTYLPYYLNCHKELNENLAKGEVAFFVNGYSRGGATANLLAKRLVDRYQINGDAVYAYCIECPQGAVHEEEKEGMDYTGIHNIINPNDLVCYVGPTLMGFKRYGVDHYICGKEKDYDYIGSNYLTPADNQFDAQAYPKQKQLVIEELKDMLNTDDVTKYAPYEMTYKKLDLRHFEIKDVAKNVLPMDFIGNFMTRLMYNQGKMVMDRGRYQAKLEGAVRNLMLFWFAKPDFKKLVEFDNYKDVIFDEFTLALGELAVHVKAYGKPGDNVFEVAWKIITGSDDLVYKLDLNDDVRRTFAGIIKGAIKKQTKITKYLDEVYPTKAEGALKDIGTVVFEALCGENNIDDFLTMGFNGDGIFRNHATYQAIAWLRVEDTWFPQTGGANGGW